MTDSSTDDNPPHLRLTDFAEPEERPWSAVQGGGIAAVLVCFLGVVCLPLALVEQAEPARMSAYVWGVCLVLALDGVLVLGLVFWRWIQLGRLGEYRFSAEAYEGSLPRNLVLGGGMHLAGLMLLWIPLLKPDFPAPVAGPLGPMLPFMVLAGLTSLAAVPWLTQFALGIRPNTLECHDEGLLIGAFYPCRWARIESYSLWEDDCSMVTFHLPGRGTLEVFMSTDDRDQLVSHLEQVIGPPSSIGGRTPEADQFNGPRTDRFSVFR